MIRAVSTYHEGKRERRRAGRIQNRTLIKLAGSQSHVVNSQPLKQDIFAPEGYGPDLGHAQISFIAAFSNARKARACRNALFLDQISEGSSMFRCSMLVCALTFCRFCLQESPRKVSSWCEKEILTCIYRCFWRENLTRVCFRVVPFLNLEVRCHDQVWKVPENSELTTLPPKAKCQAYSCSTCKWISSTIPRCVLCPWFCACIKALGPKSMTQRRIEEPACQADILQYLLHVRALFLDFHQGIRIGSSSEFCNLDADDENCFGVCGGLWSFCWFSWIVWGKRMQMHEIGKVTCRCCWGCEPLWISIFYIVFALEFSWTLGS